MNFELDHLKERLNEKMNLYKNGLARARLEPLKKHILSYSPAAERSHKSAYNAIMQYACSRADSEGRRLKYQRFN